MSAVFVNGVEVVREGRHTNAKPGRIVRGIGWRGDAAEGGRGGANGKTAGAPPAR